jgi:hypothetical protein
MRRGAPASGRWGKRVPASVALCALLYITLLESRADAGIKAALAAGVHALGGGAGAQPPALPAAAPLRRIQVPAGAAGKPVAPTPPAAAVTGGGGGGGGGGDGGLVVAPRPRIFDMSDVKRQAEALVAGAAAGAGADSMGMLREMPKGVAYPAAALPWSCHSKLGYNKTGDAECYWSMDAVARREASLHERYSMCWGRSGANASAATAAARGAPPLLYHTVLVDALPPTFPLTLWSFLASQCCDAQLWVWVAPGVATGDAETGVPAALLAGRVVFKQLDLGAAWREVKPLLPADTRDAADADARAAAFAAAPAVQARANWARLLLLALYGGIYVDADMVYLRDWRPVLSVPRFALRAGFNIFASGSGAWARRVGD